MPENIRRERKGWLVRVQASGKRYIRWVPDRSYDDMPARSLAGTLMARDELDRRLGVRRDG